MSEIFPPIKPPCERGEIEYKNEDGEIYCVLDLGEKKESYVGWGCPEGYAGRDGCVPCQEVEYICPETGSAIQKELICSTPGIKVKTRSGVWTEPKTVEQATTDVTSEARELFDKGCEIKTPGFFYDKFKEWKAARLRQQLQAYLDKGFKEELVDGGRRIRIEIEVRVKESIKPSEDVTGPRELKIYIEGYGADLEAAKKNWLDNAVTHTQGYQLLPPLPPHDGIGCY